MPRSPYAGRRPATSAPQVDQNRLIARYRQAGSMAQCAREFGLTPRHVKAILTRNNIPATATPPGPPDEEAVIRAYTRTGSVAAVARLHKLPYDQVRAILAAHAIPRPAHGQLPLFSRTARRARQRQRREPQPSDLLTPAEAARITGTSTAALHAAASAGHLTAHGPASFPRYRRDQITTLAATPSQHSNPPAATSTSPSPAPAFLPEGHMPPLPQPGPEPADDDTPDDRTPDDGTGPAPDAPDAPGQERLNGVPHRGRLIG